MLRITLLTILCSLLSGCPPVEPECYSNCPVSGPRTWGVEMKVDVHPAAKASQADIEVTITRPSYSEHVHTSPPTEVNHISKRAIQDRAVEEGEAPYDEEVELELFWSCLTVGKEGKLKVKIEQESATSKVKITDLPSQPTLAVYRWESKRGFECVVMTADEKIAQEEEQREQEGNNNNEPEEEETSEEDGRDVYRGEHKFFIKKEPPQLQLTLPTDRLQVGSPDSYADIKVELLRDDALVVAGDRSYDMDVEVKLPWSCSIDSSTQIDSGDTHIIIPAGASSAEARLILPAQQTATLECEINAAAYIDSHLIGNASKSLAFRIAAK